jgi:SPP1 family predicted phage head-tail adaptor
VIIGELRHRLALQSATDSTDNYGQPTRSWATYATVWGKVLPVTASESQLANQQQTDITHRITIRHRADVTAEHRIIFGSRTLNIRGVRDLEERGIALEIDAEENG